MQDNVIHKIGFRTQAALQQSSTSSLQDPFTFDSRTHFFDESDWHFSDVK